jgi:hypothetical protein
MKAIAQQRCFVSIACAKIPKAEKEAKRLQDYSIKALLEKMARWKDEENRETSTNN